MICILLHQPLHRVNQHLLWRIIQLPVFRTPQGIEKSISKMDETKAVFVDLKNKVVVVEAKEGKTLNEKLISQEIKDSGYDVVKIETIPQTVAQFRAQQKDKK